MCLSRSTSRTVKSDWRRHGPPGLLVPILGLIVLALSLSACSQPGAQNAPANKPVDSAASGGRENPGPAFPPVSLPFPKSKPSREQILRLPLTEPPTIDPGKAEDTVSVEIVSQIFEGLVSFDEHGTPSGAGAERWDISPDGLTYTFRLRGNAVWTDAKPVTAHDYVWAWRRNLEQASTSPYASALFPVSNARMIAEGTLDSAQLGAVATNDRTLVVTLEQPSGHFLRLVSSWATFPLRRDVIEQHGDRWTEPTNVVGNGPFRLHSWAHDASIVLERNESHWDPKPQLRRVTYKLFPPGGTDQVLAAFRAGELDATNAGGAFEVPRDAGQILLAASSQQGELKTFDRSATMFVVVNHRRPHLQDPRVRLALGQALDRSTILSDVLRRPGTPSLSLLPEGIAGSQSGTWVGESTTEARKLLAEAGYPDGNGLPEITFIFNESREWRDLATYLQRRWGEVLGIRLRVQAVDWSAFLGWPSTDEWVQRGDLLRGGWFSEYEDPHAWFAPLWHSAHDAAAFNSGWRNDAFDELVRQAPAESNAGRRASLYAQAEAELARDYPAIPVFRYGSSALVKPYVKGFQPDRVMSTTPLRTISISD